MLAFAMFTDEKESDYISRSPDVSADRVTARERPYKFIQEVRRTNRERSFSLEIPRRITETEISTIPRVCLPRVFSRRREIPRQNLPARRESISCRNAGKRSVSNFSVQNPWPPFSLRVLAVSVPIFITISAWRYENELPIILIRPYPFASSEFDAEEIYFQSLVTVRTVNLSMFSGRKNLFTLRSTNE